MNYDEFQREVKRRKRERWAKNPRERTAWPCCGSAAPRSRKGKHPFETGSSAVGARVGVGQQRSPSR